MEVPDRVVELVQADSILSRHEATLKICLIVASAVHHVRNFLGGEAIQFELTTHRREPDLVKFLSKGIALLSIKLPVANRYFEIRVRMSRAPSVVEKLVLATIASTHVTAAKLVNDEPFIDLTVSFLEQMDDVIANRVITNLARREWNRRVDPFAIMEVRQFFEGLMTASYEGQAAEIAVSIVKTHSKSVDPKLSIGELLSSKKTSALFAGHRHVLLCNLKAEVIGQTTLPPYPDIEIPRKGSVYFAPYEYQPVMKFSRRKRALTFLLSRRREITVILSDMVFTKDYRGWRIIPTDSFLSHLSELIRLNSEKRLRKRHADMLAVHLGMLSLSLRHRGKGGLLVIQKPNGTLDRLPANNSSAENFYQQMMRDKLIFKLPVSLQANAAAIDGATILTWNGYFKRFGVLISTNKLSSKSEGARTRAAECVSADGVAIKISEDGPITIFSEGQPVMTFG